MIDESVPVSKSVIFIANISVIGIMVILHIGTPLVKIRQVLKPQKMYIIKSLGFIV